MNDSYISITRSIDDKEVNPYTGIKEIREINDLKTSYDAHDWLVYLLKLNKKILNMNDLLFMFKRK